MTIPLLILILIILISLYSVLGRKILRGHKRRKLHQKPFPRSWRIIIENNVPLFNRLPKALQGELLGHILVFLDEKKFEGAAGLQMDDEIKLTIAAQACILLLNRETDYYSRLYSIIVYPQEFQVPKKVAIDSHHHIESSETHLGESWKTGAVVLSWDHIKKDIHDFKDGSNLILHEFAHQLDQEDGSADGTPRLDRSSHYLTWARVLGREFYNLQSRIKLGIPSLLDEYGATNEAEFFAVATEFFFEKPEQLYRLHPDLYEELKKFYRQNPMEYI